MGRRKKPVSGSDRRYAQALLVDIVAREVMPPCSSCSQSGEKCRLRAGDCVCVRCLRLGRRCDLFLTREDGMPLFLDKPFYFLTSSQPKLLRINTKDYPRSTSV